LSNVLIVWCVLIHVKHYKLIAGSDIGIMTSKKQAAVQKLVATKTAEEMTYEEYQKQLELAIENH